MRALQVLFDAKDRILGAWSADGDGRARHLIHTDGEALVVDYELDGAGAADVMDRVARAYTCHRIDQVVERDHVACRLTFTEPREHASNPVFALLLPLRNEAPRARLHIESGMGILRVDLPAQRAEMVADDVTSFFEAAGLAGMARTLDVEEGLDDWVPSMAGARSRLDG